MSKYTTPCPHCGAPMEREATLDEVVADTINDAIGQAYNIASKQQYWPGTNSLTKRVLELLKVKGIAFVEADRAGAQLDGYMQGLRKAREIALQLGSPMCAKLTELIDEQERKA